MSRRVTLQTKLQNGDILKAALTKANCTYSQEGSNYIRITSGEFRNVMVNLTTGDVSGDSDYRHTEQLLSRLNVVYNEELTMREANMEGAMLTNRQEMKNGEVVLTFNRG